MFYELSYEEASTYAMLEFYCIYTTGIRYLHLLKTTHVCMSRKGKLIIPPPK